MQAAKQYTAFTWNYLSIGMDAKTVYQFDQLRQEKPKLAPGGSVNKFWYGYFCCCGGWFTGKGDDMSAKVRPCWLLLLHVTRSCACCMNHLT